MKVLKLVIGFIVIAAFLSIAITACKSKTEVANPSPTPTQSVIETFAKTNNISVELAESLSNALSSTQYTLSSIDSFDQIDDWAKGTRYKMWMDGEYIWFVVV